MGHQYSEHRHATAPLGQKAALLPCTREIDPQRKTHRWREMDSNYWSRHGETPLERPCGFRARLRQLGEALIPRGTKSSNPASCSGVPRDIGRGLKNHRLATYDEQGPQRDGERIFAGRRGNDGGCAESGRSGLTVALLRERVFAD